MVSEESSELQQLEELLQKENIPVDVQHRILGSVENYARSEKLEVIGILAGSLAHDLNNILTAIVGNISLAQFNVNDPEKVSGKLTEAQKGTDRAVNLAKKLLTFSRGGAPVKEYTPIKELLDGQGTYSTDFPSVFYNTSIPDNLWNTNIDPGQIKIALDNVILNAYQAIKESGSVEVFAENIRVGEESLLPLEQGGYVKISIKDTGIGIATEHLGKIFDPFYRVERIKGKDGQGLGLSITYSIIKKHGGHIEVQSQLGEGTTVFIYLPASSEITVNKEDTTYQTPSGQGRVLVMDDEETIRTLLNDMLTRIGYEVTTTQDGTEAVESYKKARDSGQPYHAVIMDLTIPGGMGGKKAVEELMRIDHQVKAIVSSGYSNDPVMANPTAYGFKDVITKPYNLTKMEEVLHKVIQG